MRIGKLRMLTLERDELAHEPVELGVGDLRRVADVVELFVMANLLTKVLGAFLRGHDGHDPEVVIDLD
jgi:hypothetical protein